MRPSIAIAFAICAVAAPGCLLQGLELEAPADGATVTSPLWLSWIEPDGTDADEPWTYEVSVRRTDGTLAWFGRMADDTSVQVTLSPGEYTWSVRAISDDTGERRTGSWSFTVVP
jgi:hypothetical protein